MDSIDVLNEELNWNQRMVAVISELEPKKLKCYHGLYGLVGFFSGFFTCFLIIILLVVFSS